MKKYISLFLLSVALLGLVSCNSDKSKIKTVITSFFTALNHKDPQSAKLYATKESADFLSLMHQQILQTNDTAISPNEKFLISDIKVNGDIATASVRSETQQNPLTVTVKKINGDWKVAFDKNSIATMMGGSLDQSRDNLNPSATQKEASPQNPDPSNTPSAPGQTLNLTDTSVTPANGK